MTGLYAIKPWFVGRLRPVEDALVARRVSPDALTYAGVAAACGAAAAIVTGAWLLVPLLVFIRLAANALDGSVARRTGSARGFGMVLNELCDRFADTLMFASLVVVAAPIAAVGALIATLLSSFVGVLALGVTGERDYQGPMGKADRMMVVAVASIAALRWETAWTIACGLIAAGAVVTGVARIMWLARGETNVR